jgi:hypothetical protein
VSARLRAILAFTDRFQNRAERQRALGMREVRRLFRVRYGLAYDFEQIVRRGLQGHRPPPESRWPGCQPPVDAPVPMPGTWGDHPGMPSAAKQVALERPRGGDLQTVVRILERDPHDPIAAPRSGDAGARLVNGAAADGGALPADGRCAQPAAGANVGASNRGCSLIRSPSMATI